MDEIIIWKHQKVK